MARRGDSCCPPSTFLSAEEGALAQAEVPLVHSHPPYSKSCNQLAQKSVHFDPRDEVL